MFQYHRDSSWSARYLSYDLLVSEIFLKRNAADSAYLQSSLKYFRRQLENMYQSHSNLNTFYLKYKCTGPLLMDEQMFELTPLAQILQCRPIYNTFTIY